jgi:hypothetical protein
MFPRRTDYLAYEYLVLLGACWLRPKLFTDRLTTDLIQSHRPLNADHLGSVTNGRYGASGETRSGCGQAPSGNSWLGPICQGEPMAKSARTSRVNEVSAPATTRPAPNTNRRSVLLHIDRWRIQRHPVDASLFLQIGLKTGERVGFLRRRAPSAQSRGGSRGHARPAGTQVQGGSIA